MGGSLLSCCGAEMCVCCTLEVDCETDMKCPFCRALCQVSDKESERRLNQRMEVNDPRAFTIASAKARLAGDLMKALEMQLKAVELGCWNSFSGVGVFSLLCQWILELTMLNKFLLRRRNSWKPVPKGDASNVIISLGDCINKLAALPSLTSTFVLQRYMDTPQARRNC